MKNLIFVLAAVLLLASCDKWENCHKKEKRCPVVTQEQVPQPVAEGFKSKYPNTTPAVWFNKEGKGYCAIFTSGGKETKANFDNNGSFVSEEIETEGNNHQKHHNDIDCECELED